ncbi:MAG: hypothetical protein KGI19_08930 [Thaumarchaeota archaeon]|nr:hypothetical protein [Nitrososphaerota archaeon]
MKIYYAHAMCIYGTEDEEIEKGHIKIHFPEHDIVDPGSYASNIEKRNGGMEYCKKLVSNCDALVFTRLLGKVTAGVGIEVHHALSQNKPVFELKNGKVKSVKKPLKYISRENTIHLYGKWRMRKIHSLPN